MSALLNGRFQAHALPPPDRVRLLRLSPAVTSGKAAAIRAASSRVIVVPYAAGRRRPARGGRARHGTGRSVPVRMPLTDWRGSGRGRPHAGYLLAGHYAVGLRAAARGGSAVLATSIGVPR